MKMNYFKCFKCNLKLFAILLIAITLRSPYFTSRSLWFDEASSWQTARFSLPDMMEGLRLNVHMPLYYLTLKTWMFCLGDSVASLRGLSLLFGALTVAGMYYFGRELYSFMAFPPPQDDCTLMADDGGESLGLTLAALVALSPVHVLTSVEARMYSLGTFLASVGGYYLLRFLRKGGDCADCILLAIATILSVYTHNYLLFTVFSYFVIIFLFCVFLYMNGERPRAGRMMARAAAVAAAAAAAFLPWLSIMLAQARRVQQDYWIGPMTWDTLPTTFAAFVVPPFGGGPLREPWVIAGWVILEVFAISVALLMLKPGLRRGVAVVVALAVIPMACSAAISLMKMPIWHFRYFRFSHLFFVSILGLGLWHVWASSRNPHRLKPIFTTVVVALMLAANFHFWSSMELAERPGAREVVEAILANADGPEMIVALDYRLYFPIKYYAGSRVKCRLLEDPDVGQWGPHLIRPDDLISKAELDRALRDGVWIISDSRGLSRAPFLKNVNIISHFTMKDHTMRHVDFKVYRINNK